MKRKPESAIDGFKKTLRLGIETLVPDRIGKHVLRLLESGEVLSFETLLTTLKRTATGKVPVLKADRAIAKVAITWLRAVRASKALPTGKP